MTTHQELAYLDTYLKKNYLTYIGIGSLNGDINVEFSDDTIIDIDACTVEALKLEKMLRLFPATREYWQRIMDNFAIENLAMGIIEDDKIEYVADAFRDAAYYLSVNASLVACSKIDSIVRDEKYLTDERLTKMKNDLLTFISEY